MAMISPVISNILFSAVHRSVKPPRCAVIHPAPTILVHIYQSNSSYFTSHEYFANTHRRAQPLRNCFFHQSLPSHDTRPMRSSITTSRNAVTNTQGPGNECDPQIRSKVPMGIYSCSPEDSYLILKFLDFTGICCRSGLQLVHSRVVVHTPAAIGELKSTQALLVEPTQNPKFESGTSTINRYRKLTSLRIRNQIEGDEPILVKYITFKYA